MNEKRYYRAIGIAEYIAEGHTINETREEFNVSRDTIERDLQRIANYGRSKDEWERNLKLVIEAKKKLHSRIGKNS